MTTKYNPAECERLIAEAREADAATHREEPPCDHSGCISRLGLHDDACSKRKHRVAHVDGWSWKEVNLRALADQLSAARAEVERLTSERDLMRSVVDSAIAEQDADCSCDDYGSWNGHNRGCATLPTSLALESAVDAYRAARDGEGG